MNEENVNKKEKKSKRKLIMILIIILFVLLISSSITYYFLVYTKNNDKNIKEKVEEKINNSDQTPIIHSIDYDYITYYEIKDALNNYENFINLKKSMGKKPGEVTELDSYYYGTSETEGDKDYIYIDNAGKFVFEIYGKKYYAKGITGKIVEYIYISGGEENSNESLLLSETGELYYWASADYPAKNYEFEFTLLENIDEKVKGLIVNFGTFYSRGCGWVPSTFYAITENGIKRIDTYTKSLKENIDETFKISYYYGDNIFVDTEGYVLIIKDLEKYNCEVSIPEKLSKDYYLLDENNKKVKVNYAFEVYDSSKALYLITDKNQIIKFNEDYDVDKKPFNLYTNKKVKQINAINKKLESGTVYYRSDAIEITYEDNSVEIFKVKDK